MRIRVTKRNNVTTICNYCNPLITGIKGALLLYVLYRAYLVLINL